MLAGCGSSPESVGARSGTDLGETEPASSEVVLPTVPAGGISEVGLEGMLTRDQRCLYLTQPGATARALLVFALPVEWDNGSSTLRAGTVRYAPDSRVALGGRSVPGSEQLTWVRRPDAGCEQGRFFLVTSIEPAPPR